MIIVFGKKVNIQEESAALQVEPNFAIARQDLERSGRSRINGKWFCS